MRPIDENRDDALIFTGIGSLFAAIAAVLLGYQMFATIFAFFSAFLDWDCRPGAPSPLPLQPTKIRTVVLRAGPHASPSREGWSPHAPLRRWRVRRAHLAQPR